MTLDAIAAAVIKTVGQFFVEVVFVAIFCRPGWLILRVLTLGLSPPKRPELHRTEFVAALGFAAIVVSILLTVPGGGL